MFLQKLYEDASQFANDAVGSIRTVSSFCAEDKIVQLYKKKSEGPLRAGIRQGFITGSGIGISMFLLFSVYATCFYAGARFLEAGKIKVPEIFQVCVITFFRSIWLENENYVLAHFLKIKLSRYRIMQYCRFSLVSL